MATQDCIDAIRAAFKGKKRLSDADIERMAEDIFDRAGPQAGPAEFKTAAEGYAREVLESAFVKRRNRKINFDAQNRMIQLAKEGNDKFGDPSLGLRATLVGTTRGLNDNSGRLSVDTLKKTLWTEWLEPMLGKMDNEGLTPHFNSDDMQLEIMRALEKITDDAAKGSVDPKATRIAEIIHEARTLAFDERNRRGAWVKRLRGFIMRQQHDMDKMFRAGFDEWKDFILPRLHPRTFDGVKDTDKFLRGAFKGLTSGEQHVSGNAKNTLKVEFTGPGNLAKARSEAHRSLHFKGADESFEYMKRFGASNLRESLMGEFTTYARDTALMMNLGTNPKANFDSVRKFMSKLNENNPKKLQKLRDTTIDAQFDIVTGRADIPVNMTLSKASNWAKFAQNSAKLGSALISSVVDPVNIAASLRNQTGMDVFTALKQGLLAPTGAMKAKELRKYGRHLAHIADGTSGAINSRFNVDDNIFDVAHKANRIFFKLNGLTWWTDSFKEGQAFMVANHLGDQAGKTWDVLHPQLRFNLEQFGIDAAKWDTARQHTITFNGDKVLLAGDIPDPDLARAFRAFTVDSLEAGVPSPGAREKAILTRGLRAGTPEGEALRHMAMFKGFPTTVATKVVGRAIYNNADGRADKVGLAMYIAASTALGYVAMVGKDLAKGRTPRDFRNDPLDVLTAAMVQGGGLGIYGDFIFAETNRFGRSLVETIAGPTFGTIGDIHELWAKFRAGEETAAKALRVFIQNAPGGNLFYTRAAMDYLIFYHLQEMANPGYLRRAERRLERDQGQTYIFPPSQSVPRGGDLFGLSR